MLLLLLLLNGCRVVVVEGCQLELERAGQALETLGGGTCRSRGRGGCGRGCGGGEERAARLLEVGEAAIEVVVAHLVALELEERVDADGERLEGEQPVGQCASAAAAADHALQVDRRPRQRHAILAQAFAERGRLRLQLVGRLLGDGRRFGVRLHALAHVALLQHLLHTHHEEQVAGEQLLLLLLLLLRCKKLSTPSETANTGKLN